MNANSFPNGYTVPKGAIPLNGIPNLKGQSIVIVDQATPDPTYIMDFNVVKLLKSWGANASIDFVGSEQIAAAEILRGTAQVFDAAISTGPPDVANGLNIVAFGENNPRIDYEFLSSETSLKAMAGQNFAISQPGTITDVLGINIALASVGLASSVHIVIAGGQTLRADALASGKVQGTVVGHLAAAQLGTKFHNLYDFTIKDPWLYNDLYWAEPSWVKTHAKMAVALNLAALDTWKWFNTPKYYKQVVTEGVENAPGAIKAQAEQVYAIWRKYQVLAPGSFMTKAELQRNLNWYRNTGGFTPDQALPLARWVTTAYDGAAVQAYDASNHITP